MRRSSGDDELGGSDGFAPGFELSLRSVRRLEDQHGHAAPSFPFNRLARAFASGLLVRGPKKNNTTSRQPRRVRECFASEQRGDKPTLHIENARTKCTVPSNTKGHLLSRAELIH